jgi:hypothetical protein
LIFLLENQIQRAFSQITQLNRKIEKVEMCDLKYKKTDEILEKMMAQLKR